MPWSPRSRRVQDETNLSPRLRSNEESAEVHSPAGDRRATSAAELRREDAQNADTNATDSDILESGLSGPLPAETSTQMPPSSTVGIIGSPAPMSTFARPVAVTDAADDSEAPEGTRLEPRSLTSDASGVSSAIRLSLGRNEALGAMLPNTSAAQSHLLAEESTAPDEVASVSQQGLNVATSETPTQNDEAALESNLQGGNTISPSSASPLPLHLAGLPAADREALQRRRAHELAVDEARAQEPRRRIGRSALQLYAAATGTLAFLTLLLVKDAEEDELQAGTAQHPEAEAPLRWMVVLAPLAAQYLALALLTALDVRDACATWAFLRQSLVPGMEIAARHQILAKIHETLWHCACTLSAFLLAVYLETRGSSESGSNSSSSNSSSSGSSSSASSFVNDDIVSSGFGVESFGSTPSSGSSNSSNGLTLVEVFAPIWLYGLLSVVLGLGYIAHWWAWALETKKLMSSLGGVGFALMARVLPIALIVDKILGRPTPWSLVFLPLWASVGALALIGTCVACMVPVLVLTQDEASLLLGWIVGVAALFLLIPAVCTLTFLALLCRYLEESTDDENSAEGSELSLAEVLTPLFVMYGLLACLTPLLMRVITSTHQTLDAMNAHPLHPPPGADGNNNNPAGAVGPNHRLGTTPKRPGIERDWPDVSLAPLFAQQTSTLFRKLGPAAGEVQRRALIAAAAATAAAAAATATSTAGEGTAAAASGSSHSSSSAPAEGSGDAISADSSGTAHSSDASTSDVLANQQRPVEWSAATRAPTTVSPSKEENEPLPASPNAAVLLSTQQSDSASNVEMVAYGGKASKGRDKESGEAEAAARSPDERPTLSMTSSAEDADAPLESAKRKSTNTGDEVDNKDALLEPSSPPETPPSSSSSPSPSPSSSSSEAQCFVCCERQRDAVVQPCGHGGMCYQCAVAFVSAPAHGRRWQIDASQDDPPKCPLCRAPVVEVLRLTPLAGFGGTFVANASWTLLSNSPTSVGSSGEPQGPLLNGPRLAPLPGGGNSGGSGPLLSVRPAPSEEQAPAAAGAAAAVTTAAAVSSFVPLFLPSTTTTTTTTTYFLRRHSDTQEETGGEGNLLEEEAAAIAAAAAAAAQEMSHLAYDAVLDSGRDQQSHDSRARYGRSSSNSSSSSSASSDEGTVRSGVDVEAGSGALFDGEGGAYFAESELSASESDVSTPRSDVSGAGTPVYGSVETDGAALERMRRVDLELGMNDEP